jgi:hypothetical protein
VTTLSPTLENEIGHNGPDSAMKRENLKSALLLKTINADNRCYQKTNSSAEKAFL